VSSALYYITFKSTPCANWFEDLRPYCKSKLELGVQLERNFVS